jgi:hypothetical protein
MSFPDLNPGCLPKARAKGRIEVSYVNGPCIGSIFLDIYKEFNDSLPPIIGPICVAVGDTVTYSVCEILSTNPNYEIGQDNYFWTTPAGFRWIYNSSDSSSQTYVVDSIPTDPLQVQFGRCNSGLSTLNISALEDELSLSSSSFEHR